MKGSRPALQPMLGAMMREALRTLSDRVARDLHSAGFTDLRPSHLAVFQHLDADGTRLTGLAARAQMTKQSMGALVDDLERLGYVEKFPDPTDGRARIVVRTDRGWDVERVARESVAGFETVWRERVGPERMEAFLAVLREFPEEDGAPR